MKARVFFAICFPHQVLEQLNSLLIQLKTFFPPYTINWTPLEKLHITLGFLADIRVQDIEILVNNARRKLADLSPFFLEFLELELFPSPKHPRIISLKVGPPVILKEYAECLAQAILQTNYPVETQVFRGHLTLGRIKMASPDLQNLKILSKPCVPNFQVNQLQLLESKLYSNSHYYPLACFDL
jgi:2'-5' RNA ligase